MKQIGKVVRLFSVVIRTKFSLRFFSNITMGIYMKGKLFAFQIIYVNVSIFEILFNIVYTFITNISAATYTTCSVWVLVIEMFINSVFDEIFLSENQVHNFIIFISNFNWNIIFITKYFFMLACFKCIYNYICFMYIIIALMFVHHWSRIIKL